MNDKVLSCNVENNNNVGGCFLKLQYKDGSNTDVGEALSQFPAEVGSDCDYKNEQMVLSLNRLYQNQKGQLKGLFTLGEANLLISAFNGFMYTPWNDDKGVLLRMVEDVINYEYCSGDIYDVDKDKLFQKIHKLNSFDCFVVIRMAFEFWKRKRDIFGGDKLLKDIFGIK
ncbi:hypothetical protein G9F72_024060 [Clostridium estertheticum]|uniref:hypothetical protein n=1 Tax=Clostridium estertheticum TaxID=238834 RepID=UPI0013E99389|nr:hypothetical protein [Clostridium estertheticum]MBZ9689376.1 hypothetical protein [Clostridium estertheticum]